MTSPKAESKEYVDESRVEFQHDLIPLPVAARVVYARIYEDKTASRGASLLLERLDDVAAAIAGLASLYAYEPARSSAVRRLTPGELQGGTFRSAGNELHFNNGREPLRNMAVARADLEQVIALLEESPTAAARNGGYSGERSAV